MSTHNPIAGIRRIIATRGVRAAVPFARLFGINTPELFIAFFLR
jgi:hypothetical protein